MNTAYAVFWLGDAIAWFTEAVGAAAGVLEHFYRDPAARAHVRRLAAELGVDSANLSREPRRLEAEGFLKGEAEGRNLCYSIDSEYPELKTVVELMRKLFDGREER